MPTAADYSEYVMGFLLPINRFTSDATSKINPIWFQTNPIISDSKDAQFESHEILGRAEPVYIYRSSGSRKISLELTYIAQSNKYDVRWVANQISRLRALVYPIYSRNNASPGIFAPPPMVLLNYGSRFINIPCIVESYNISYQEEDVIDVPSMLPFITKVSLNLATSYPYMTVPGHDDVALQYLSTSEVGTDIKSQISISNRESAANFQNAGGINYEQKGDIGSFEIPFKNNTVSNATSAAQVSPTDLERYSFYGAPDTVANNTQSERSGYAPLGTRQNR